MQKEKKKLKSKSNSVFQSARKPLSFLVGIVHLLVLFYVAPHVSAAAACTVTVSPAVNAPLQYATFNMQINNTGTEGLNWIRISRPSSSHQITALAQAGWDGSFSASNATMSGSSLEQSSNFAFSITAYTFEVPTANEDWLVEASTSATGESPVTCTGSTSVGISAPGAFSDEGYSNLAVSNITDSSAVISWQTFSAATGIVYYGVAASYSNYTQDPGPDSVNHQVVLSGLSPSTAYDFQIAGSSGLSYSVLSSQQSFTTLNASTESESSPQTTPQEEQLAPSETVLGPADTTAPVIRLESNVSQPFQSAVTLKGAASDNVGLSSIDYSLDGGQNWLPAATVNGGTEVAFEFVPAANKDGNYSLMLRARDFAGNQGFTPINTLIIDSLPPTIGGVLVSAGSMILHPDQSRTITTAANVELTYTVSVIGGATDVSVVLTPRDSSKAYTISNLNFSSATGLWQGPVVITEPGDYQVEIQSIDGGKTQLTKQAADMRVESSITATDSATGEPIDNVTVDVFRLNPDTNRWDTWNGDLYGQKGSGRDGKDIGVYLPSGTYYLHATSDGYHGVKSAIFTVDTPTIVTHEFKLHTSETLSLGLFDVTIPRFGISNPGVKLHNQTKQSSPGYGLDTIPFFELPNSSEETVRSSSFFGKPTVLAFVNTWSHESLDLLRILNEIQSEDINIVAVFGGESVSRVSSFADISGLSVTMLADTNNTLSEPFNVASPATLYFVSRSGDITSVHSGLLDKTDVIHNVSL